MNRATAATRSADTYNKITKITIDRYTIFGHKHFYDRNDSSKNLKYNLKERKNQKKNDVTFFGEITFVLCIRLLKLKSIKTKFKFVEKYDYMMCSTTG